MAQWLQLQLAQISGIAANFNCILPAAFIWRLMAQILPESSNTEKAFSKAAISWKLMALLPTLLTDERCQVLNHYLKDDQHGRKSYQLAQQVADLFDRYLVYRPEWLTAWEEGQQLPQLASSQAWQARLWQALVQYTAELGQSLDHRAALSQRLLAQLQHSSCTITPLLPKKRLFIMGISALPPMFLTLLQALAQQCEIHLMLLEPCRYYWADIAPLTSAAAIADEHPLLAAWGQAGREQRTLLLQGDVADIDAMVDINPESLLQALQYELLELVVPPNPPHQAASWRLLDPRDHSLTLHACYSPHREVELLQDTLLGLLEADNTLTPRDIMVMVTDLQRYAPYIQTCFGQAPPDRYLPFSLAEQHAKSTQPIPHALLKLFSLPSSRYESETILALLELPAVAARFSISSADLQRLRQWVTELGIRWGLDDDDLIRLQLPTGGRHTWQSGLQRLLLGYAVSSERGPFREQLPYDLLGSDAAELVGCLANFLEQLSVWRQRLASPQTLTEWLPCCRQLLEDFFIRDASNDVVLNSLEQLWQRWINQGIEAQYTTPISINLLQEALAVQLQQLSTRDLFFTGAITFSTLMPMRATPHKVICMLGMNEECFPRSANRLNFDLISGAPRLGDNRCNQEDRYLFLELLLSARSTLHISYVGRSIQDNQPRQPSIVVSELLDHCCQHYRLQGDEALSPASAAQSLRQQLHQEHPLTPFNARCFHPENPWQSYAIEWLAAAQRRGAKPTPFCQRPLSQQSTPTELALSTFKRFYRHPVRSFFQQRLQVAFRSPPGPLVIEEPFTLDPLIRYSLNRKLLTLLIQQHASDELYQRYLTSGLLPQGAFGELLWQQQCQVLQPLASQLQSLALISKTHVVDLTLIGIRLHGELTALSSKGLPSKGLLRWQPLEIQIGHVFELWLDHLLLCAMGSCEPSHLYGLHQRYWGFASLPCQEAQALLSDLLEGWRQGQQQPLLLLLKCGWSWLQALYQPKAQSLLTTPEALQKAQYKLQQTWQGNRQVPGESSDPYYQRLLYQLTPPDLSAITAVAKRFLLPLAQWRQSEPPNLE
jgi:exodeoxyribonuclease V gamma subunit